MEKLQEKRDTLCKRKREIKDEIHKVDAELKRLRNKDEIESAVVLDGVQLRQRFFDKTIHFCGSNKESKDKYGNTCMMDEIRYLCLGMEITCDARDLDYLKFQTLYMDDDQHTDMRYYFCSICLQNYRGSEIWRMLARFEGIGPEDFEGREDEADKEQLGEEWDLKSLKFCVPKKYLK